MIVYQATKQQFLKDTRKDIEEIILDAFKRRHGHAVPKNEVRAWKYSLEELAKVLDDEDIPSNAGIAVEYTIPQTCKRVDLLITGTGEGKEPRVVIVELKQWESAALSMKDGLVSTRIGGAIRETSHPSYQAWSYKLLLEDFNEAVERDSIALQPCAYLHNYVLDDVIRNDHYRKYWQEAPVFLKGESERQKLRSFIKQHVRRGDDLGILYTIEEGRIRPSKLLAESVRAMLKGQREFVLVDEQKVVYETAVSLARIAQTGPKQVFIVEGGPGTGKSVVAINILSRLLRREGEFSEQNCRYVSRNAAPRAVYQQKLSGERGATRLKNLFCGSGAFVKSEDAVFDTLIVDEAHRLNEKSGRYGVDGENQIKEIIHASRCAIFFIDEDQRVTWRDIGTLERIEQFAAATGAKVSRGKLESQFRCNGSEGYLAWLDNTLQVRETANSTLSTRSFDFQVFDSPVELHAAIVEKNKASNRARVVAGYCWDWKSKKDSTAFDIELPEFGYRRQWNLGSDGSLWIIAKESVAQVGCIHTCQGLEVDYIGVIVGNDLVVRDGRVVCGAENRSRHDQSVKGWRKAMKSDPKGTAQTLDAIIKNTYRTLMSRGMKGCYIYCTDPETASFFRSRLDDLPRRGETESKSKVIPFPLVRGDKLRPYINALPLVDLKMAAGLFSKFRTADEDDFHWVAPEELRRIDKDMFVAQVVGESMNNQIPNGAWCVFRLAPRGSKAGRVVLAELHGIGDPENGGAYTVKVYRSEKYADDHGHQQKSRVTLEPNSTDSAFQPLVFDSKSGQEVQVIAELVQVLGKLAL